MEGKTLREVCELVGVTRRAVQGYEKVGLVIPVGKNKYGYLLYGDEAIEKIRMIKQYQDFGFTVKKIKVLLQVPVEEAVVMLERQLILMRKDLKELEVNIKRMEQLLVEKRQ